MTISNVRAEKVRPNILVPSNTRCPFGDGLLAHSWPAQLGNWKDVHCKVEI